jgi:hypothetical protein
MNVIGRKQGTRVRSWSTAREDHWCYRQLRRTHVSNEMVCSTTLGLLTPYVLWVNIDITSDVVNCQSLCNDAGKTVRRQISYQRDKPTCAVLKQSSSFTRSASRGTLTTKRTKKRLLPNDTYVHSFGGFFKTPLTFA